jgi:putative membrane protein
MSRCIPMFAAGALVCLLGRAGLADDVKTGDADQDFVIKAISSQIGEIKLAETAVKNGSAKEVRDFAQMVVDDHTKVRDALMEWAKNSKLVVVQGLEKEYKEKVSRLSKVEGAAFDREFMKIMVGDHEKSLQAWQAHAKTTSDRNLKKLIEQTAPTVREHLKHAQKISSSLK